MAIDVNKPSSSDYPTKPTPPVSPPPCRDHQHNNNRTIPTITRKDQAIDISHGFSNTSDQEDFNKMTLEQYDEKSYNYFDNIDDDNKVVEIPRHVRL